jgi:hypothetical protein
MAINGSETVDGVLAVVCTIKFAFINELIFTVLANFITTVSDPTEAYSIRLSATLFSWRPVYVYAI